MGWSDSWDGDLYSTEDRSGGEIKLSTETPMKAWQRLYEKTYDGSHAVTERERGLVDKAKADYKRWASTQLPPAPPPLPLKPKTTPSQSAPKESPPPPPHEDSPLQQGAPDVEATLELLPFPVDGRPNSQEPSTSTMAWCQSDPQPNVNLILATALSVRIPDLVGVPLRQALVMLRDAGLLLFKSIVAVKWSKFHPG